jgi:hypothetical protein
VSQSTPTFVERSCQKDMVSLFPITTTVMLQYERFIRAVSIFLNYLGLHAKLSSQLWAHM